jgi:hypothetical protein
MDKKLLIEAGLELVMALIRGGLSFARTLGVPDEKLDEAYAAELARFRANHPDNLPDFGDDS